eukprot:661463-Pleurochrysis_carterae.AAC.2
MARAPQTDYHHGCHQHPPPAVLVQEHDVQLRRPLPADDQPNGDTGARCRCARASALGLDSPLAAAPP